MFTNFSAGRPADDPRAGFFRALARIFFPGGAVDRKANSAVARHRRNVHARKRGGPRARILARRV